MRAANFRVWLRYFHIVVATAIAPFFYSQALQSSEIYELVIKFVLFPLLALSGVLMWQQRRLMKVFVGG